MILWAIIGMATIVSALFALKLLAIAKARPAKPAPRGGMVYATSASDIDLYVTAAEEWWQHVKAMPLFWVSVFFTGILIVLDYAFGYSRAGLWGAAVLGSLFAAADVAIPFIALKGEPTRKRDPVSWTLLVLFTLMSMVVVIGSTAEVSTTTGARNDVGVTSHADDMKLLTQKQGERDSIPMNRGFDALDKLAAATEEAAGREGGRTRCGDKCESLKTEAKTLRAQADEAKRKERLTGEIEALKVKLAGGGLAEARMDSDPLATAIEGMSGGTIPREHTRRYGLTVLGIILVVGVTMMWMKVGDDLHEEIAWETKHRGEIADATRANLGMGPRYTSPEPVALLAGPGASSPTESVTINVVAQDMRRHYANDQDLLETDGLFEKLLDKTEGGSVTFAALYKAYQVAIRTADPEARYMTLPTMAAKIYVISKERGDVRTTADGVIQGWVLKPIDQRKLEVKDA